jgi:hypothetical protein
VERIHVLVRRMTYYALIPLAVAAMLSATPAFHAQDSGTQVSQPGAPGKKDAATQPAVPVPPGGPIPAKGIKPAPPTPIAEQKDTLKENDNWNPQWDVLIEENLPAEMLSPGIGKAVGAYCPHFSSLPDVDKRAFWAYLFQALSGAEAGLIPTTNVRHTDPAVAVVDGVSHRMVRSEGLLQLTYEDSERYGCDFDWNHDKPLPAHDTGKTILQPRNNLLCGIRIMKNQLVDLHEPLLTSKSYWSTLRPGTQSYRVFAKQMANAPAACGTKVPRSPHRIDENVRVAKATVPANHATSAQSSHAGSQ